MAEVTQPHHVLVAILQAAKQQGASDLHLKAGAPPRLRVNGKLYAVNLSRTLTDEDMLDIARSTMKENEWQDFHARWEKDYSLTVEGVGRFRVNAFHARGSIGMVMRRISPEPPTVQSLHLPESVCALGSQKNGFILVCGATGSGKSTTLAAIVNLINHTKSVHIVTIEDPIEYIHSDVRSVISQREVSSDTKSFADALHSALRQDPDVISLGEMRSEDTARTALTAAETGHLVMSTLHTTTAADSISRFLDFFSEGEQKQVRATLASSLRGVVCQRLLPTVDGKGRVAAIEVLLNVGRVPDALMDPAKYDLGELIAEGSSYGMQSFEDHLEALVLSGSISMETAMANTLHSHDFAIRMRNKAR